MNFLTIRALMVGNALEYYDFFLYSFFVSILSPLFFPASDPLAALMMGFGVFAIGFVARPVGALVFGHWGDRYGRKKALLGTLLLMAGATVGIGLLPTYATIGPTSSFLLVLLRFLQGLAAGGEVNGAAILGIEQTTSSKRGFAGALINSSAGMGAIMATMMGAFFTQELMPPWAWRIPFFLGGFVAFVGFYLRKNLEETKRHTCITTPLLDVIQNHTLSFLKALGVGSFIHVPFYIIVGYMNPTLHAKGLISPVELMLMNMSVTLTGVLVMPIFGHYADKIGPHRLMIWGAVGQIGLILPVFLVYTQGNILGILFAQIGLLMAAEAFIAPSNAYLSTLFPPTCRYSGIAVGACLGMALFGGTTPLLCSQLAQLIGPLGPSLYGMGIAFIGLLSVIQKPSRFSLVNSFR